MPRLYVLVLSGGAGPRLWPLSRRERPKQFLFFSGRSRHPRCSRDWSSDVCSSDLRALQHTIGFSLALGLLLALASAYVLARQIAGPIRRLALATRRVQDGDYSVEIGVPSGDEIGRSEEHTSELQSRLHLVCRLLLEKKKKLMHDSCGNPRAGHRCVGLCRPPAVE